MGSGRDIDLSLKDLERGLLSRLTFDNERRSGPTWSPDGKWIAYGSRYERVVRARADGTGLTARRREDFSADNWSRDFLLYAAPHCDPRPSDCADLQVVNELDGFNVHPRLSIPFDGPIDPGSITDSTVFLLRLGARACPRNVLGQP
jgi:hypothetical protein